MHTQISTYTGLAKLTSTTKSVLEAVESKDKNIWTTDSFEEFARDFCNKKKKIV